ncbi:MAG: methyltransferase domain-containing protein [Candidatus Marinamargulisbacteria bacterium]
MTKTFEKAAETYRFNAKVQQKTAENIMSMCSNVNPKVILDIGCGSGILTEKISKKYPSSTVTAIDSSANMLKQFDLETVAKVHANFEEWTPAQSFDLIVSNAALHWMNIHNAIDKISSHLAPSGRCIASIYTKSSCQELKKSLKAIGRNNQLPVDIFPSINECTKIIKDGFKNASYSVNKLTVEFKTIKELLINQKKTGVNQKSVNEGLWTPNTLSQLEKAFIDEYGSIRLTYDVITFKGLGI